MTDTLLLLAARHVLLTLTELRKALGVLARRPGRVAAGAVTSRLWQVRDALRRSHDLGVRLDAVPELAECLGWMHPLCDLVRDAEVTDAADRRLKQALAALEQELPNRE